MINKDSLLLLCAGVLFLLARCLGPGICLIVWGLILFVSDGIHE